MIGPILYAMLGALTFKVASIYVTPIKAYVVVSNGISRESVMCTKLIWTNRFDMVCITHVPDETRSYFIKV